MKIEKSERTKVFAFSSLTPVAFKYNLRHEKESFIIFKTQGAAVTSRMNC